MLGGKSNQQEFHLQRHSSIKKSVSEDLKIVFNLYIIVTVSIQPDAYLCNQTLVNLHILRYCNKKAEATWT